VSDELTPDNHARTSATPFQDAAAAYGSAALARITERAQRNEPNDLSIHQADGVFWALRALAPAPTAAGVWSGSQWLRYAHEALQMAANADEESWSQLEAWQREERPFDQSYFLESVADLEKEARLLVEVFDAVQAAGEDEDRRLERVFFRIRRTVW
jgi:hypothetical protein